MLILRVGNSPFILDTVGATLRKNGISNECAVSGREALEFLRLYDYDLVLMDHQLADVPAHEVVRMIRAASLKVPVAILSGDATVQAKVRALDQGADDFLSSPCDAAELLARVRAIVRRSQGHAHSTLSLGPVELLLDRRDVRVHGQSLHLSRREYAVLELLFLKQGVVLTKGSFLTHLLLRYGRARDEDDRRHYLPPAEEAGDGGRPVADRYGMGLRLYPPRSVSRPGQCRYGQPRAHDPGMVGARHGCRGCVRPGATRAVRRRAAAPAALICLLTLAFPALAQVSPCEQAGIDAERQFALPSGLLLAIGRVESGRWDPELRRTVPWPWAIDAAGAPTLAASKQEALLQTQALQSRGLRNIDVGCYQISLLNHPDAFASLEQAFDPVVNAQYAARFLTSLHARLGDWEAAVAAYHSSTPTRGLPYRDAVYATWSGRPSTSVAGRSIEPVVIYLVGGVQISVWTPSPNGTAAGLIGITRAPPPANSLPRIITPGR
jgi:DNA-binding response OmpR family regulator